MTSKVIEWDKLDEMKEKSDEVIADFKRMDEIRSILNQKDDEREKLRDELNSLNSKYRQEYSDKPNKHGLDKYGVLTIVMKNETYDSHILCIDENSIKVEFYYNYGQYSQIIDVPTKELQEKGYYHYKEGSYDYYIVDDIKDPLNVYEIIKWRLNYELSQVLQDIKWRKESIAEYTKKLETSLKELDKFKKVSDGKITQVFNEISFGVTHLKIEDILKVLPRTVEIYEEKPE